MGGTDGAGDGGDPRDEHAGAQDDADTDEDRDAIVRRRNKLIAVALGGLVSAAGCDSEPQVCLNVRQPDPQEQPESPDEQDGDDTSGSAEPKPCLSKPMPSSGDDAGSGDGEGDDETSPRLETEEAEPRPCLRTAAPRRRPDEDDEDDEDLF